MKALLRLFCAIFAAAGAALAAGPEASIKLLEPWRCLFGGKECVFHARMVAGGDLEGRLVWRLADGARTIRRGETALGGAAPAVAEIKFIAPEVKPGVIYETRWTVALAGKDGDGAAAAEVPIWLFPENPFHERQERLGKLDIVMFDPEQTTGKWLTALDVPFRSEKNVDALEERTGGLVMIGEGVSFRDYRGLPDLLMRLAGNGSLVLCLAPADAEFPIAGIEGLREPSLISFCREEIIKTLDKRLDDEGWPPDGNMRTAGLKLRGERGTVFADVSEDATGWPWVEMRYGKGCLIICCFSIMEKWEAGPVPRFLLAKILEYMDSHGNAQETQ